MNRKPNDNSQNSEAMKAAKNEPHFSASDLIAELSPLIRDYFLGDFYYDGEILTCLFPNGQKFKLTIEEIK